MELALSRGPQDDPLPDRTVVLRGCRLPADYPSRPLSREAFNFQLSVQDKQQPVPKLSVYAQGLTTEEQVCAFIGDGSTHRLIARLNVASIRRIGSEDNAALDVVWDDALLPDGSPDTRPGSLGHAGIVGLGRPPGQSRAAFKALQVRLADAVGRNYRIVPAAALANNDDVVRAAPMDR
jgi:hypothetical protein